ncbi:MAG: hypothetical protein E7528_05985 [Ruminococcaceae bacterium]|nr:hypothetical protein [Oscillospiraceae bacterium]
MIKTMKKSVSILLILTLLFSSFAIMSSALTEEDESVVMPRFTTISSVTTSFTISGLNSTSTVLLKAKTSTSLYIKIELQKEKSSGYETIETWTKSGTGYSLLLEETRLINVFSEYRIKVTCTAGSETHTTYDYP